MPRTTEIPRDTWKRALDEFSAIHEGWLISLDVLSDTFGAQPEVTNLPLVGVTFEADHGGQVIVAAARSADDHITHTIHAPRRVWIERTDDGADVALEIESADRTKVIVRFRAAALPETVDGVVRPQRDV